jgi:3-methyladenine DNA glycosylase AlkD
VKPAPTLTPETALRTLLDWADPAMRAGQSRFGINPAHGLGVSMPRLRQLARGQRDHALAAALWASGYHEARILAALVDDPAQVDLAQMEAWVADFDSWDICDQVIGNLFDRTPQAAECALAWSRRAELYVRRAGFVLMAEMAVHRKDLADETFLPYFPLIVEFAIDERNFVSKAVNWALRQLGKRSPLLWKQALETARTLSLSASPAARWVGADAQKELRSITQKPYIRSRWGLTGTADAVEEI